MNNEISAESDFQLSSGGLVHLIQRRMRGPGAGDFPVQTQLLIAITLLWLPLVLLTLIAGTFVGGEVVKPFINDLVPQVRFLIALPLLVFADMAIDPAVERSAVRFSLSTLTTADEIDAAVTIINGVVARIRRVSTAIQ